MRHTPDLSIEKLNLTMSRTLARGTNPPPTVPAAPAERLLQLAYLIGEKAVKVYEVLSTMDLRDDDIGCREIGAQGDMAQATVTKSLRILREVGMLHQHTINQFRRLYTLADLTDEKVFRRVMDKAADRKQWMKDKQQAARDGRGDQQQTGS